MANRISLSLHLTQHHSYLRIRAVKSASVFIMFGHSSWYLFHYLYFFILPCNASKWFILTVFTSLTRTNLQWLMPTGWIEQIFFLMHVRWAQLVMIYTKESQWKWKNYYLLLLPLFIDSITLARSSLSFYGSVWLPVPTNSCKNVFDSRHLLFGRFSAYSLC